jgi:hypothetical protein
LSCFVRFGFAWGDYTNCLHGLSHPFAPVNEKLIKLHKILVYYYITKHYDLCVFFVDEKNLHESKRGTSWVNIVILQAGIDFVLTFSRERVKKSKAAIIKVMLCVYNQTRRRKCLLQLNITFFWKNFAIYWLMSHLHFFSLEKNSRLRDIVQVNIDSYSD